ncbi:MAG: PilZ domain-containing protein [Thermodesulfovibrionales bacterium]
MRDRIPCSIEVVINGSVTCRVFNINEGGLYIKTADVFTAGKMVTLSLPFRGDQLEISARIKYCNEGVGMGIMFIDLDDALKGKLKALIQDIKDAAG